MATAYTPDGLQYTVNPPRKRGNSGAHTYSFSGADADVYAWLDGLENRMTPLSSVQTLSVSIHEAKGQARALGHRGVKGLARGVRTIAGSMILTVVQDNPLRGLMNQVPEYYALNNNPPGWSIDRELVGTGTAFGGFARFDNRLAPLLPPINLMIQYMSETAAWVRRGVDSGDAIHKIPGAMMMLTGVEFIDEGIVTSVHDAVSEVTLSFIACDFKPLANNTFFSYGIGNPIPPPPAAPVTYDEQKHAGFFERIFKKKKVN